MRTRSYCLKQIFAVVNATVVLCDAERIMNIGDTVESYNQEKRMRILTILCREFHLCKKSESKGPEHSAGCNYLPGKCVALEGQW